jgi:hypothetical protein
VGFENFPEIESFHKLPKKIVIKAGETAFDAGGDATLGGIVINNLGQAVRNIEVFLVLFDENNIPREHLRASPNPNELPQGALGSFHFHVKGRKTKVVNYYLHARWDYIDKGWE